MRRCGALVLKGTTFFNEKISIGGWCCCYLNILESEVNVVRSCWESWVTYDVGSPCHDALRKPRHELELF